METLPLIARLLIGVKSKEQITEFSFFYFNNFGFFKGHLLALAVSSLRVESQFNDSSLIVIYNIHQYMKMSIENKARKVTLAIRSQKMASPEVRRLGFAPTLAVGNVFWSHFDKRKEKSILRKIQCHIPVDTGRYFVFPSHIGQLFSINFSLL